MAKILIVGNDAQISTLISKFLISKGFRTRVESNGASALLAAHEDLPDVILMDLMMPILEGHETLQALRHDPRTAHIPVVVLANQMNEETLAGALTAGANVYLTKPPDLQALLSAVERLASLRPKDIAPS
ncbi:MAG TPA: response regulator [Armatimonadota bacterium]|nr:response regulator [Armatimonadota bacterium]